MKTTRKAGDIIPWFMAHRDQNTMGLWAVPGNVDVLPTASP